MSVTRSLNDFCINKKAKNKNKIPLFSFLRLLHFVICEAPLHQKIYFFPKGYSKR